jgi:hypothetical protein
MRLNLLHTVSLFAMACAPEMFDATPVDAVPDAEVTLPVTSDQDADGDEDADRLFHQDELTIGTDPLNPDSDHDGYVDGDEVFEGTSPLSADERIYQGGWPYNADKDGIDVVSSGAARVGDTFLRFGLQDQYGDVVDLFDLVEDDTYVVVSAFGAWCSPCQALSAFLAGEDNEIAGYFPSLRGHIESGRVRVVEVMVENMQGEAPTHDDVVAWHRAFPAEGVPMLADEGGLIKDYGTVNGFVPAAYLLDGQGRIVHMKVDESGLNVMEWIEENL